MPVTRFFNPEGVNTPGTPFMQVARVRAEEFAFVAGQVPVTSDNKLVGAGDFKAQCEQVFTNIGEVLKSLDAGWPQIVQFISYLTRREDLPAFRQFREERFPQLFSDGAYPPNTLVLVSGLAHEAYLIEVQLTVAL